MKEKEFNTLVETLNHRVTKVEVSVRWIKYIVGYISGIMTLLAFKLWGL